MKAPPRAPPAFNWTGIYAGLNAGYSFGASEWTRVFLGATSGNFATYGFLFGGTLGTNYQFGRFVVGVEGDGGWADANGFGTFTAASFCVGGCLTSDSWLATVRGRAGYTIDRLFVYATGGAAFGDVRANFSNDSVSNATEMGWTVGGGVEVALTKNWSAKAEYLFVDLGDGVCIADCAIQHPRTPPTIPDITVKFSESLVRAGINYKFGG